MSAPVTLQRSTDGTPTAVQHTHALLHIRMRDLVRDHAPEIAPEWYRAFARAAFVAWLDSRAPVETTPIAEVLG